MKSTFGNTVGIWGRIVMMNMRTLALSIGVLAVAIFTASPAQAACTGPAAPAGKIIYNGDHNVLQYCDDTNWIAFPKAAGTVSWATPEIDNLANPNPTISDEFGISVALDGNVAVVGAHLDDPGAVNAAGIAYVFDATTNALVTTLNNPAPLAADQFGFAVDVSGNIAVVGAHLDNPGGVPDSGTVYTFNATTGALVATINNPASTASDWFGYSVGIDGNSVVVGAPQDDPGGFTDAGTAYVFNATTGALIATLNNPNASMNDRFGTSVAISGNLAIVGAYYEDPGAVSDAGIAYVFNATTGALVATLNNPAPLATDLFGISVAIDGNVAVVGASHDNPGGVSDAGSAYVFNATTGALTATLSKPSPAAGAYFGREVAVSGNVAVIGSLYEAGGAGATGTAYSFDATTGVLIATLADKTPAVGDYFSHAIDVSGDKIIIGAYSNDTNSISNSGAAYIFEPGMPENVAYNWNQPLTEAKITATGGAANDEFGNEFDIDGNWAVIGAHQDQDEGPDTGSAYVFERVGGTWVQRQKLNGSQDEDTYFFGSDVSISGDTIAIGAIGDDEGAQEGGTVYIFTNLGGTWTETQKLVAADADDDDEFGTSLSIDGDNLFIGAPGRDNSTGTAYVFKKSGGTWTQAQQFNSPGGGGTDSYFGYGIHVNGNDAVIGEFGFDSFEGRLHVYTQTAGTWSLQQTLYASDPGINDEFGAGAFIDGDRLAVTSPMNDDVHTNSGSIYIFERSGGVWTQTAKVNGTPSASGEEFGSGVVLSGNVLMTGSWMINENGTDSGAAMIYIYDGTNWVLHDFFTPPDNAAYDHFGYGLALSGNTVLIGALGDNSDTGAVYSYTSPWNCVNPVREAGTMIFNDDDRVLQWCAGDEWQAAGPVGPTTPETGCSNPTGTAGRIIYNQDYDIVQYCDGADWIGIGK